MIHHLTLIISKKYERNTLFPLTSTPKQPKICCMVALIFKMNPFTYMGTRFTVLLGFLGIESRDFACPLVLWEQSGRKFLQILIFS